MSRYLDWERVVAEALKEDLGDGDVTTEVLGIADVPVRASIIAKGAGVLFGVEGARRVFSQLDRRTVFRSLIADGAKFDAGTVVAKLSGNAGPVLAGERVALNFLQELSGIATLTARFVEEADTSTVAILDTRKTTPGLRPFEKAAVLAGGGRNHRFGLYDGILIKDNHKRICGGIGPAVETAKKNRRRGLPIIAEAETAAEAGEAAAAGADVIMLDNFLPEEAREACAAIAGRAEVEISGGVTLRNVSAYAHTGASRISVGALTHSAPAVDFSLEVEI